jgi:hypothetical protein
MKSLLYHFVVILCAFSGCVVSGVFISGVYVAYNVFRWYVLFIPLFMIVFVYSAGYIMKHRIEPVSHLRGRKRVSERNKKLLGKVLDNMKES